jgi:hypothetical protein
MIFERRVKQMIFILIACFEGFTFRLSFDYIVYYMPNSTVFSESDTFAMIFGSFLTQ